MQNQNVYVWDIGHLVTQFQGQILLAAATIRVYGHAPTYPTWKMIEERKAAHMIYDTTSQRLVDNYGPDTHSVLDKEVKFKRMAKVDKRAFVII